MKITDLEIGQFATRNWYNNIKSLCVKRYNLNIYEYWEDGQFSSIARDNSSIFNYSDFKLCDCNGKLIEEFTYPLYMESIGDNSVTDRVVKFVSLTEGTVIIQGNSITLPSHRSTSWIKHMNTKHWKPYDFSKAPEIDDLDYWDARYNAGLPVYFSFNYENNKTCYKANLLPSVIFKDNKNIKFHISCESKQKFSEPIIGVDYASQPYISFVPNKKAKSRLYNDALDAFSYAQWNYMQEITGATENVVKTNYNKTKEFTMNNDLKEAILELIATNGKPKVKKPKTPKIVCNVEGTLMEFADEAALKSFMWSSRVESVIRYDLAGKVTVPFELSVEAPKTKASK